MIKRVLESRLVFTEDIAIFGTPRLRDAKGGARASTIIHHQNIPRPERRQQYLLYVCLKHLAVGPAVEDCRGAGARQLYRQDDRGGLPVAMRDLGQKPLAQNRRAAKACQVALDRGLVGKDELFGRECRELLVPEGTLPGDVRAVLLAGTEGLF